jgi:hypothetical protein
VPESIGDLANLPRQITRQSSASCRWRGIGDWRRRRPVELL